MRLKTILVAACLYAAGTLFVAAQQAGSDKSEGPMPSTALPDPQTPPGTQQQAPAQSSTDSQQQTTPQSRSAEYFTLEVCNRNPRIVNIAVSSKESPSAREWYIAGWWKVAPAECRTIGRYPKSIVYLHAEDTKGGRWNGRDVNVCVEKQKFKRINQVGYKCAPALLRGFFKKNVTADKFTWTLTPG